MKFLKPLLLTIPLTIYGAGINSSIGKGHLSYDSKAGLKDRCINITNKDIIKEDVRVTNYYLNLVKTKEELYDKTTSSASAEGSYGVFSAKGKSSFVREVKWNHNSNYILVRAVRVTHKESISMANTLLNKNSRNLSLDSKFKFLQSCGDSFAKNVNYGGEVFGIIEITSQSYEEKKKIENSLNASGSYGGVTASGSGSYKREIKKLTSTYKSKVSFRHVGGEEISVPSNVDGLLKLSSEIERITDKRPVPISIETRKYNTLSNFVHDDITYETIVRQDSINLATNKLKDARELYSKILVALEYPKYFRKFNSREMVEKLDYLDEKIIELKEFIAKSYSFLNESDPTALNVDLNFSLPKRKKTLRSLGRRVKELPVKCEVRESALCGVKSYKNTKSSACNVLGLNTGTGPSCGTVFINKRSKFCGVERYRHKSGSVCGVRRYNQCHHRDCGKKWNGANKRCRTKRCGVESYNSCRHSSFGAETFNKCRNANHGIEKYLTCQHTDFGYNFESCQHLTHGPDKFNNCEVAKVGNQTTFCPSF